jgi:hypothetical protein
LIRQGTELNPVSTIHAAILPQFQSPVAYLVFIHYDVFLPEIF